MKLRDIDADQFEARMDYLRDTAGIDLTMECAAADRIGIDAKVQETLQNIQRWAGECAKFLSDKEERSQKALDKAQVT